MFPLFYSQMKQPDLYERMQEVKLLVEEKRVNNVELLQQELDLLHQGLKQEAAKGTSRRRTRGGPAMAAEAAAALKEGGAAAATGEDVAVTTPPKPTGDAVEDVDEEGKGRGGDDESGQVEPVSQVQDKDSSKLVEGENQVSVAAPKAALQRGGRPKISNSGLSADSG